MKTIMEQVMDAAKKKIDKKLAECEDTIKHFTDPFPVREDYDDNIAHFEAHTHHVEAHLNGRFSSKSMRKTYDDKRRLVQEQYDLINFRFLWDRDRYGGRK